MQQGSQPSFSPILVFLSSPTAILYEPPLSVACLDCGHIPLTDLPVCSLPLMCFSTPQPEGAFQNSHICVSFPCLKPSVPPYNLIGQSIDSQVSPRGSVTWTHLPPSTCSPGFPPASFQVLLSLFPLPGTLCTTFFTWLTVAHPSGFSSVVNLFLNLRVEPRGPPWKVS